MVATIIYLLMALIPYMGRIYVSEETKARFQMAQFYGEGEIPERVMLVESPEDAFFHRMNLISNAQEEIIFTTYNIHDGTTTDLMVGALLASAERGVTIRILNDGLTGRISSRYLNVLAAHENIDIYFFHPFEFFRPQYINSTLHDKYMIVDNTFMLLGGRNIGDKYFNPDGFQGVVSLDREVLIYNTDLTFEGSIVQTQAYFEEKINSNHAVLQKPNSRRTGDRGMNQAAYIALYKTYRESLEIIDFDYYKHTIGVNAITLIYDPFDIAKKESVVAYNLYMLTQNSEVIIMQSPYVVLTNRNFNFFAEAVQDRDVTLLTNSLASTPNLPAFSAYYISRRNLLTTGITIYEYQSATQSLHGKTYLFDGRLTAIGSFNINERSIRSDTETMLIIDSETFHDIVLEAIHDQMSQSLRVGNDNQYERNPDVEKIPVSVWRRILYIGFGYLMRPLRFLS